MRIRSIKSVNESIMIASNTHETCQNDTNFNEFLTLWDPRPPAGCGYNAATPRVRGMFYQFWVPLGTNFAFGSHFWVPSGTKMIPRAVERALGSA